MSELEKAARAVVDDLQRYADQERAYGLWRVAYALQNKLDALRAALEAEAEAGWGVVSKFGIPPMMQLETSVFDFVGGYEYRIQRRQLVDHTRDQALHPHEGDEDHCARCGEHRSWHDE